MSDGAIIGLVIGAIVGVWYNNKRQAQKKAEQKQTDEKKNTGE